MSDLPEPFTTEDCDLRGYEWMPLFGARLFSSTFEAHASDLAFRVAIRLYWECWQQVPAASLPNDDVQLCRLSGLGRDMKTWRKLRADGVLHGFILCSDDRLYHRLLADEAVKAWEGRRQRDHEREGWRARKQRQRANSTNGTGEHVPRDIPRDNGKCPPGSHANVPRDVPSRASRQDRTGQDKNPPYSPPQGGRGRRRGNAGVALITRDGFETFQTPKAAEMADDIHLPPLRVVANG